MAISLITGTPGAGKSLYAVSQRLAPLVGTSISYKESPVERTLMVGGVRDLLLPHELVEVPEFDADAAIDLYGRIERMPGDPPVEWVRKRSDGAYEAGEADEPGVEELVVSAVNWWLWCRPGQVIVIDECQRLFRPAAAGKKLPKYIAKLETHRHYGVDFVVITQHPQLLHVNVRNLVGSHEHVRRIFGRGSTVVYQWDHCTNPDKTSTATKRMWRHDKKAFDLYKSAEVHTKSSHRLPLAVYLGGLAILGLAYAGWTLMHRLPATYGAGSKSAAAGSAPSHGGQPGALPATASPPAEGQAGPGAPAGPRRFPAYVAEEYRLGREPLDGRGVQLEGSYTVGGRQHAVFGLVIDDKRVASINLVQLVRMGYAFTEVGPCAGLLRYGQRERVITCQQPQAPTQQEPASIQSPPPGAKPLPSA